VREEAERRKREKKVKEEKADLFSERRTRNILFSVPGL